MKKSKKFAFIQGWGTYSNETLVVVGMGAEEIINYLHKNDFSFSSDFTEQLRQSFKDDEDDPPSGRCVFDEGRSMLWLPSWKDDWENWETLMHEIVHLIHRGLCINKFMSKEDEAQAYQMEYLFRNLRTELHRRTHALHKK